VQAAAIWSLGVWLFVADVHLTKLREKSQAFMGRLSAGCLDRRYHVRGGTDLSIPGAPP